jgi:hypothetical protein
MSNGRRREMTSRELQRQRRKEQIQRRRVVAILCLVGLLCVIVVLATTCGSKGSGGGSGTSSTTTPSNGSTTTTSLGAASFSAALTGKESVPAVDTSATGTFTLTYDPATQTLSYELHLKGVDSPRVADIYEGAVGDAGTPAYVLYPQSTKESGAYTGRLAKGDVDESALMGSLGGKTLADLIALIRNGNAYVSVGTKANPVDGIRGQIVEATSSDTTTSTANGTDDTSSSTDDTSGADTTSTAG